MKAVVLSRMLVLDLSANAAFADDSVTNGVQERLAKDIPLQGFFHLAHLRQLKIYQPAGANAEFGNDPVRECSVGSVEPRTSTPASQCTSLFEGGNFSNEKPAPLQILVSADLVMLPGAPGQPPRPSLVIPADFSGGGLGVIKDFYIWTLGASDDFLESFHSSASMAGEQALVRTGTLAGAFVAVEQVCAGDESNMESPVRYEMRLYEPPPLGYERVLSFLSEKRYPGNHTRDGLPNAISTLTPMIVRTLKAV